MTNNLGFDDDFMATMLSDFLDESHGYLTRLNENLLVLDELAQTLGENAPVLADAELLNEMFRDAHSLKGLSAMLQLTDINSLTHKVENVFDAARQGNLNISRSVIDVMFQAFDRLSGMVERLKDSNAEEVKCHEEVESIQRLLAGAGLAQAPPMPIEIPPASALPAASINIAPQIDDVFGDLTDETDIPPKYLSMFIGETEESLDALAEMLFGDKATDVNALLVLCHRIKGSAASIGLHRTAKLAHAMEDLLQVLREAQQNISTSIADTLLAAVDSLRAFVKELQTGVPGADNFGDIYPKLRAARVTVMSIANGAPTTQIPAVQSLTPVAPLGGLLTASERARIGAAAPFGRRVIAGVVLLETGLPLAELKAQMIFDRLSGAGRLFFREPAENELDSMPDVTRLVFGVATELSEKVIRSESDLEGVRQIELLEIASASTVAQEPVAQEAVAEEPVAADVLIGESSGQTKTNAATEAPPPTTRPKTVPTIATRPKRMPAPAKINLPRPFASISSGLTS